MSKRDRAARAKGPADADATDVDAPDTGTDTTEASDELKPSGKRSSTPRGKRGAATAAGDTAGDDTAAGGVALKDRPKAAPAKERRGNPFTRLWVFLTQVVSEMRKVIWPSRQEMIQYTIIVLIFVIIMTAFISGIDLGFARLVLWLFG
ncbi:preprotein translocase subunit SecE [Williamsia deligens]|uniref:Protein translocase subunit SecE n=1 Tax=Williamsia deligens TaxID=321325 RepID=A0ABW3G3B1_9NOCA|nr:preprotein translocase subunit SecE [Williamsia deligens]MCP2194555.1 preprotein translocase subunit SecE [Williamsia deligens]